MIDPTGLDMPFEPKLWVEQQIGEMLHPMVAAGLTLHRQVMTGVVVRDAEDTRFYIHRRPATSEDRPEIFRRMAALSASFHLAALHPDSYRRHEIRRYALLPFFRGDQPEIEFARDVELLGKLERDNLSLGAILRNDPRNPPDEQAIKGEHKLLVATYLTHALIADLLLSNRLELNDEAIRQKNLDTLVNYFDGRAPIEYTAMLIKRAMPLLGRSSLSRMPAVLAFVKTYQAVFI